MSLAHYLGLVLAAAEVIYARAHLIVAKAPGHPSGGVVRNLIAFREGVVVPVAILALTYLQEVSFAPGLLAACAIVSLLSAVVLFRAAPMVQREISRRVAQQDKLQGVVAAAAGDHDQSGPLPTLEPSDEGPAPRSDDRGIMQSAIDELRQRGLVVQALWDLPVGLVFIDREGKVESRTGGALRSATFPPELAEGHLGRNTEIASVVAHVLRTGCRQPFELHRAGRAYSGVVSPWVSRSGRTRGTMVLILNTDETTYTDEANLHRLHA